MRRENIIAAGIILGLGAFLGIEAFFPKTKTIREVESEEVIVGSPNPFGMWDAHIKHDIIFEDGSTTTEKTRDYDYHFTRLTTGIKPHHPQQGEVYRVSRFDNHLQRRVQ